MPQSWIKDEEKWKKAKSVAKKQGKEKNYAYVAGIYKRMISNESTSLYQEYLSIITEAKFKDHAIAYHGTSDVFLRSIMKNGLVPTTEKSKRVWGSPSGDRAVDYHNKSLESIIGSVYLSFSLITASSGAYRAVQKFGGSELIIVAEIMPESSYLDEDYTSIPDISYVFGSEFVATAYAIYSYFGLRFEEDSTFDPAEKVKEYYKFRYNHIINNNLANEIIDVLLKRFFYYRKPSIDKDFIDTIYCILHDGECFSIYDKPSSDELKTLKDKRSEFFQKHKSEIMKTYSEGFDPEQIMLDLSKKMSVVLKNQARSMSESGMGSIRFETPVKFSGSNRIIAIYKINKGDIEDGDEIIEVYNKSNFDFLSIYRSTINNKAIIKREPYEP